jgi:hypothetical protein
MGWLHGLAPSLIEQCLTLRTITLGDGMVPLGEGVQGGC